MHGYIYVCSALKMVRSSGTSSTHILIFACVFHRALVVSILRFLFRSKNEEEDKRDDARENREEHGSSGVEITGIRPGVFPI